MKLLYFGDIVGKSGRQALFDNLPALRERYGPDFVMVNGENAAHGFGITAKICNSFFEAGVDAITLGNHAWDQREIMTYIQDEPRLIRPLNYPETTPGAGAGLFQARNGARVFVAQVMGRLFMEPLDDPFAAADTCLGNVNLTEDADCIVLDIHAEATSEKMAMGHYLDGKVTMVVGTHSHIPTADAQVLPCGTAYQTDVGMCGDYDSVIGMKKTAAISKFIKKLPGERLEPAEGVGTACAVLLETDDATGLARGIVPVRAGGRLRET